MANDWRDLCGGKDSQGVRIAPQRMELVNDQRDPCGEKGMRANSGQRDHCVNLNF